jgi:leucyl aminopeptidase
MAENKKSTLPSLECKTSAGRVDTQITLSLQSEKAKKSSHPDLDLLGRLEKSGAFKGALKSSACIRFQKDSETENLLFVGLGDAAKLQEESFRVAGSFAYKRAASEKLFNLAVDASDFQAALSCSKLKDLSAEEAMGAFSEGFLLTSYGFDQHKSKKDSSKKPEKLTFVVTDPALKRKVQKELDRSQAVAETTFICRDWGNQPGNIGTPSFYAAEGQRLARQYGIKAQVMGEKDAKREKMDLFLSVGQGSAQEGKILILEYQPKVKKKGQKTIALVGKGITFDTGGISLKPGAGMEEMKFDMGGAATLFASTLLAAKLEVPHRIVAVLGFTENMPSSTATKPGDVITGRSGKTVEVINTDAEGRLILADLLDYAQKFKPDGIVDAATLTGAVLIALGNQCSGVLGNNDAFIQKLIASCAKESERAWQLPLYDEYYEDIKSDYADIKNVGAGRMGGTITAAMFLKQFVDDKIPWAHLDIAATAWNLSHLPYCPNKGGSGYMVRGVARFLEDY